jgi:MYXO-CTERM domain-containing protein
VLYLAAVPGPAGLELRGNAALASLLGVPGEIRLGELAGLYELAALEAALEAPLETTPQPVPEPGGVTLLALGLGALARVARRRASCHPAGRWSGPPHG